MTDSVLIYQIGALGDTIVSIPAIRTIREVCGPETGILLLHNIDMPGRVSPADVLSGSGLIDGFIDYGSTGSRLVRFRQIAGLWRKLRSLGISKVFYLAPGKRSARSVARDRLFFRTCGIENLIGFHAVSDYRPQSDGRNRHNPTMHESMARLQRLQTDGIKPPATATRLPLITPPQQARLAVERWLRDSGASEDKPLIAICPGAQMKSKLWPLERFEEVGRRLLDRFAAEIVLVGGPAESAVGASLVAAWGAGLNAAGRFTVMENAALLQRCVLAITLDTGPMHIAAAVGTRCVALFSGIESPGKWDPMGEGHTVLRNEVPCAGCRLTVCPVQGHPCMTTITVDEVWSKVEAALSRAALRMEPGARV